MALGATARNLDAAQDRGTNSLSKARLWVDDRRLELLTRAFTLFGALRMVLPDGDAGHLSRTATLDWPVKR